MTPEEREELARVAAAATPGPWAICTEYDDEEYERPGGGYVTEHIPRTALRAGCRGGDPNAGGSHSIIYSIDHDEDARYIVASQPAAVLALLAEVRRQEAVLREIAALPCSRIRTGECPRVLPRRAWCGVCIAREAVRP